MKTFRNRYTLLENGHVHTSELSKSGANEMLERHSRIFPDLIFTVVPLPLIKEWLS